MRALLWVAGVTLIVVWGAAAGAQNQRPDVQAGRRLALRVCDGCHIVAANQELPPLVAHYAPSFFDVASRSGTTAQSLHAFLAHPHPLGRMPYPGLTPAQITDVSAYILSLRGRH